MVEDTKMEENCDPWNLDNIPSSVNPGSILSWMKRVSRTSSDSCNAEDTALFDFAPEISLNIQ